MAYLGYYKMEGNANDSSPAANNGTATSVTYWPGTYGQSAIFSGSPSKIVSTISSGLSGSLTFNCQLKATSLWVAQWVLESYVSSYANYWVNMSLNASNQMTYNLYDGTHNPYIFWNTVFTTGKYYMCTLVRDHTAGKLYGYINGASDGTAVTDTTTTTPTYSSFNIGYWQNPAKYLSGNEDTVIVDNTAWWPQFVKTIYSAQRGIF